MLLKKYGFYLNGIYCDKGVDIRIRWINIEYKNKEIRSWLLHTFKPDRILKLAWLFILVDWGWNIESSWGVEAYAVASDK